jgi:putative transposase
MKASKFTDAQKTFIIKQGEEGTTVAEICRKAGISSATYFNWKKVRRHVADRHEAAARAGR